MPQQTYDFDSSISRRNTGSIKWDYGTWCPERDDILPMWVADMDFHSPPCVVSAIRERAAHGVFGYTLLGTEALDSVVHWVQRRYGWNTDSSMLSFSPGVVASLNIAIQAFTKPGDSVIVQSPVYPPFFDAVTANNRSLIVNPLVRLHNGSYEIDFEHLTQSIDAKTRMLVLCSPHNPVGRVWSVQDLQSLGEIAEKHDLLIVSDEIHADLVFAPHRHVPIASLSPELAERTITTIAPSKTFNIPAIQASIAIIPNRKIKNTFDEALNAVFGHVLPNAFAPAAMQVAYEQGEQWLEELLQYLAKNRDYAVSAFKTELPDVRMPVPEATYLLWLDFTEYARRRDLSNDDVKQQLYCNAGVALNDGRTFGTGGNMHFRLNFGCPRSTLHEGLQRIFRAL